jgi:hypothetical protein
MTERSQRPVPLFAIDHTVEWRADCAEPERDEKLTMRGSFDNIEKD